jgi:2-methylcitrate dehydratase PrpD
MKGYSELLASFVASLDLNDIPLAVREKAKLIFLDTLGVALRLRLWTLASWSWRSRASLGR